MSRDTQIEYIELSFPGDLAYETIARETVASFVKRIGFSEDRIDDIKTALGEAYINASEHGNVLDPSLRIDIVCTYDGQQFVTEIQDQGVQQFQKYGQPLTIEEKLAGQGSVRGMGVMLMQLLADEASFEISADGKNCCRLHWYRTKKRGNPPPIIEE